MLPRIEIGDPADCWEWTGSTGRSGYGAIKPGGRAAPVVLVHRVVYEMFVEPVPPEMTLDHLCMNRRCSNPDHLEVVSFSENSRRGALHRWHGQTFWEG